MKKLFINLLIIIILLVIIEFTIILKDVYQYRNQLNIVHLKTLYKTQVANIDIKDEDIAQGRTQKKPIILLGCSFVEGVWLKKNENFAGRLAEYTGRTVINMGHSASSISLVDAIFEDKNLINKLPDDAEYIIYTFLCDHFHRMYKYRNFIFSHYLYPKYSIKYNNGQKEIKLVNPNPKLCWLYNFYISRTMEQIFSNQKMDNMQDNMQAFSQIIERINKKIKIDFKNTKFVILFYDTKDHYYEMHLIQQALEKIDKQIILLDVNNYINMQDKKYWLKDGHPSAEAWKEIAPKLADELKMNN